MKKNEIRANNFSESVLSVLSSLVLGRGVRKSSSSQNTKEETGTKKKKKTTTKFIHENQVWDLKEEDKDERGDLPKHEKGSSKKISSYGLIKVHQRL